MVNVLIGCTGSVAAIKIPLLVEEIKKLVKDAEVRIVTTKRAKHFFRVDHQAVKVYQDADEWNAWSTIGDPIVHIDLRNWADIFVIAPLDANTVGKLAHGMCDNLLTCIARAWDISKPIMVCPAMNTLMWNHPSTAMNMRILTQWRYMVVAPVAKRLACGDEGIGAMAEVSTIARHIADIVVPASSFPNISILFALVLIAILLGYLQSISSKT